MTGHRRSHKAANSDGPWPVRVVAASEQMVVEGPSTLRFKSMGKRYLTQRRRNSFHKRLIFLLRAGLSPCLEGCWPRFETDTGNPGS